MSNLEDYGKNMHSKLSDPLSNNDFIIAMWESFVDLI